MLRAVFVFANLVLLGIMLTVGFFAHSAAGRHFEGDVVFVAQIPDDERLRFSPSEIGRLRAEHPQALLAFAMAESGVFFSSAMQMRANIVYTSQEFYSMHFFDFLEGSSPAYATNSVLLSEMLAWRLFGGFGVVGATVWYMDMPFSVSGVAGGEHHGYTAWLCQSARPGLSASSFYIGLSGYTPVEASVLPRDMLSSVHRHPDDFLVLDITAYVDAMGMRMRMVLYFGWLVALAWVSLFLAKTARMARGEEPRNWLPKATLGTLFAGLSVFVLFTGAIDIMGALPNFDAGNNGFFRFLFGHVAQPEGMALPQAVQSLLAQNLLANISFFGSVFAIAALGFALRPRLEKYKGNGHLMP